MSDTIYLDYNATTPVDPEVLQEMLPWFSQQFWNAASSHSGGTKAGAAVEASREALAQLVGADPREIVFTSGATEADNLALTGVFNNSDPSRRRVIVGATEHLAVLDTADQLVSQGAEVSRAPVDRDGLVDIQTLSELLDESVALVSIMLANNETGVIAPIEKLADEAHRYGALFHTDATQAVGRIPVDVRAMKVDLASFSAHKMYGPKGVGALFAARGTSIGPVQHGGGHERGLRSGTLNVPGIVGFGCAANVASKMMMTEFERESKLVDLLLEMLAERIPGVDVLAEHVDRIPNTANLRFLGADGDAVMASAPDVMISSGSACSSLIPTPSHVLLAMGLSAESAEQCLRVSVGRPTQIRDIEQAAELLSSAVIRVREFTESDVPHFARFERSEP